MSAGRWLVLLGVFAGPGCGGPLVDVGAAQDGDTSGPGSDPTATVSPGTDDATSGNTTSTPPTITAAPTSTSAADATTMEPRTTIDETDDTWSTATMGLHHDDGGWIGCSVWEQNCTGGDKCLPFAYVGNTWDETHCIAVVDDPAQLGDPCWVEENVHSGIDNCDLGLMCFYADHDTLQGTCVQQCEGSSSDPICDDPSTACSITNDGTLTLCLPTCHPVAQDCWDGTGCYFSDAFLCTPDGSGGDGAHGDTCAAIDDCDPGLQCVVAAVVPGCPGGKCCATYCDLTATDPDLACPGNADGERCVPWYEEGAAPSPYADVGICVLLD